MMTTKRTNNEHPPVQTQFLIFTLFGDYVLERGGKIWTSDLLYLMDLLEVSERAVRSALSRMTRKGWLSAEKHGRNSQYSPTPRGRALLERGGKRIFEKAILEWDERWHLVIYSLPEEKRRIRHAFRTQLSWLGFGLLSPGTWISSHDRVSEVENLLEDLNLEQHVDMFSGIYIGPSEAQELVARCWDLPGLESQYQVFIERYRQEYLDCLEHHTRKDPLPAEEGFIRRFWLTHAFQSFPLIDPNLPLSLLPPDWPGYTARELFDNYHQLLGLYTDQFIDDLVGKDGPLPSGGDGQSPDKAMADNN